MVFKKIVVKININKRQRIFTTANDNVKQNAYTKCLSALAFHRVWPIVGFGFTVPGLL